MGFVRTSLSATKRSYIYRYLSGPAPVVDGGNSVLDDPVSLPQSSDSSQEDDVTSEDGNSETTPDASAFEYMAASAAMCLFESDKRRDAKAERSMSTTNWIDDRTAFALQNSIDRLKLKLAEERTGLDRDEASAWIRWMKSSPAPVIVDLSSELRIIANETFSDSQMELVETSRSQFLFRLVARLILLPSGMPLSRPLLEPPASLIYGKLIYGGVTRYRRLISSNSVRKPPRKAGERTLIKSYATEDIPAWIQYGGAERMYEGVDIGSAAVLEVVLLPRGQFFPEMSTYCPDMVIQNLAWKPQQIFGAVLKDLGMNGRAGDPLDFVSGYTPISQSGKDRNDAFESDFKNAVGGLQPQIDAIVRRVLDGRVLRPAQEDDGVADEDDLTTSLKKAAMEAEELAVLGLTPVRGLLLYGPPGK